MRHIMHRAAVVAALICSGVSVAVMAYLLTRLVLAVPGIAWAVISALFVTWAIVATYRDGELFGYQRVTA